jgi:acetate kinase
MAKEGVKVLTLNCGSSSVKYSVWEMPECNLSCSGIVERVTVGGSFIRHQLAGEREVTEVYECPNHEVAVQLIIKYLTSTEFGVLENMSEIRAVGHRVVHGGEKYTKSVVIDESVSHAIKDLFKLAPLHNPANLMGIESSQKLIPGIPNIACWDTAFSAAFMPKRACIYAIPYEYYENYRIRRYGYHGLSHLYVAKRAAALLRKEPLETSLVTMHIGNGSSITAVKNGVACDQSLGFSTCGEGPVMGTRCGDLDPEVPLTIMEKERLSIAQVREIIYKKSGILGLSGKYVDRRDVLAAAQNGDERCKLAFELECYRLKKYIGAYIAIIGGIDALVFTAGIGENSWAHRIKVCEGLEFLGIRIDQGKNRKAVGREAGENDISTPDSKVKVLVIPTDEELVIAVDTYAMLIGEYAIHTKFKYPFEETNFVPSYLRKTGSSTIRQRR